MSISDDIFDLTDILEERDNTGITMLNRITKYINELEESYRELKAQNDVLSKAIVIKGGHKITAPGYRNVYSDLSKLYRQLTPRRNSNYKCKLFRG